jgi:regulator of protease activity HflC (stomatin/prohibitin superfamily)
MSGQRPDPSTYERAVEVPSGWAMLALGVALIPIGAAIVVLTVSSGAAGELMPGQIAFRIVSVALIEAAAIVILIGLFTLQPNEARVLLLFGSYKGTVRTSGFHWANPFYSRSRGKAPSQPAQSAGAKAVEAVSRSLGLANLPAKISLRAHNFNSDKLKVNDKRGNPIEIAAVIVWRVHDTAQAAFDVEDYESYVQVQSESAIRSIASLYAYDHGEDDEVTLRGGGDEIVRELQNELGARLTKAGVVVDEARLTHLAYAPEIASAMLRRQQAEAIIAARAKIVQGAVSMVDMALRELDAKEVVKLDNERKAAMVSNLLVVLCGTEEASPVINTGTLYN